MTLKILKQKINTVVLDHMLSPYLITGSEHNGDALPKNYKGLSLSQNLQQEVQRTQLLKFIGTLQERNPGTCIKPDTE